MEEILQSGREQGDLANAARQIDQFLINDPLELGESRYDTVRVGFVRPLGVQYEVLDDVRTVIFYDVWRIDTKRET